ncbi:MAG: hypothetical protein DYG99_11925 [Bacteroidetes bacterium CHB5]|nr:hypothetical protein [Bacteroidetes bacterium CHB5]
MKRLMFLMPLLLACITAPVFAQVLDTENTYKISRASKRGSLAGVEFDEVAKTYTLTYLTDMKKKGKVVEFTYEQYVFDNNFNFVKDAEFTEEADKMKKKFKWFRFKGDEIVTLGNTVENNMMGTLVIKKKKITSKYNFLLGGYTKNVDILEKVKPKTDDGNTYTLITHEEDEMTGDLFILASVKPKIGAKVNSDVGAIRLLKFNSELDLVKTTDFKFQYPQSFVFGRYTERENFDDPESPGIESLVLVFAPSNAMGKKNADPNNNNYTYVRVTDQGEIVERFNFNSPSSFWNIHEMIYDKQAGEVYLYGPSLAGKDKYYNEGAKPGVNIGGFGSGEVKYKAVQLMKVKNGKMVYLTETNLEEFKAKQKFPPSQKKTPDYAGREFSIRNYELASNGDLLVIGQNYDKNKDGFINRFEDILGFHFDSNGVLRAQYGLDTKEKGITVESSTTYGLTYRTTTTTTKIYACPQTLVEGTDGNTYWILQEIKGMGPNKRALTYPRIGRINMGDATVTDLKTFGKGDGYYLDANYPFLATDKNEAVVFFGSDKGGRELWFARVVLK